MTRFGLSRRTRFFLLWTARLALVAYLVQLSAADHWHSHFDVAGVENTAVHVSHCHGAGDCSSGGAAVSALGADVVTLPAPHVALRAIEITSLDTPQAAFISPPSEPPQAA
jgi:hypothetical protein